MEENNIVKKLSVVTILGNVLLAVIKLIAGFFGRSGAMISDAVHSLSDVFTTVVAYIGVLLSKQPEDD
jgi:divalent metal cation (Fe/Co/Zn/Cd) transporter